MIPRKGRFRPQTNPLKTYKHKRSALSISAYANECRRMRLANPTIAEQTMGNILTNLGIKHERERIVFYADRFVLLDFYVPGPYMGGIALEIDGGIHKHQKTYDQGRDAYLRSIGINTYRFTNSEVIRQRERTIGKLLAIIGNRP